MKKLKNVSKRLLALALALALVVGYIPARASAEGEILSAEVEGFSATITRSLLLYLDVDDGGTNDGDDQPESQQYKYNYSISGAPEGANVVWNTEGDSSEGTSIKTDAESVTATVTSAGRKLSITSDQDGETKATWSGSATWNNFTAGEPITAPRIICTSGEYVGTVDWTLTAGGDPISANSIATTTEGALRATATIAGQTIVLDATVSKVAATEISVPNGGWFTSDTMPENITVMGKANVLDKIDIQSQITVNDTLREWDSVADGQCSITVQTGKSATTIKVGDTEYKWQIDDVTPTITVTDAYVSGGKTYVDVKYTVGASGGTINASVGETNVGSKTVAAGTDATYQFVLDSTYEGKVTVTLTNNLTENAKSNSSEKEIAKGLEVEVTPPTGKAVGDTIYVAKDAVFTATVKNAVGTILGWKFGENNPTTQTEDGKTATYTLTDGSVKNLMATVTEQYNDTVQRMASNTFPGVYEVDSTAPSISGAYAYIDGENTIVKVNVTDEQSGVASVTLNDAVYTSVANKYELTGNLDEVVVLATDNVGNDSDPTTLTPAPALTVTIDPANADGNMVYQDANATYLKNDSVDPAIAITIDGIYVNNTQKVTPEEVTVTDNEGKPVAVNWNEVETGSNQLTGTVTLPGKTDNQVIVALNGLNVTVNDGERSAVSKSLDTVYMYDAKKPEIIITVPSITDDNPGYDADPTVYFYNEQTVTIQIYDDTPLTGYAVSGTLNGYSDWEVLTSDTGWTDTTTEDGKNGKQYVITLGNNQSVGSITVSAMDSCENNSNENAIEGKSIEVDTHAPEVTASVNGTVTNFCLHGDNWYAEVEAVESKGGITGFIESITKRDNVDVVITVKVVDNNLATALDSEDGWTESDKDPDGNITYTKDFSVKVNANEKKSLMIFIPKIADGAGRTFTEEEIDVTMDSANGSEAKTTYKLAKDEDNNYSGTLNIDRRSPENGDNTATTPVVRLSYSKNYTTKSDKTKLFSGPITCDLDIKDTGAGLKSIKWELSDSKNFKLSKTEVTYDSDNYKTSDKQSVTITPNEKVEANTKLTITITDNMGNSYIYTEDFAEDNYGPRINVDVSGKSVRANEYFNKDRIATITVTDANLPDIKSADFASKYINVTTNATSSSWTQSGNTYVGTYTYSTDGKYQLTASGADIAGNKATVTYNGEHPTKFVVDKTAPIISVTYNPAYPSGKDRTINHYDEILTAYFSIKETNFDANDVVDKFVNSGHNLVPASWNNNGDSHTASATFNEGNNYSFSIDFTDLAGNVAVGYKSFAFCVDLHAPTIKITKGDLTTKELNIIQDDLTLGVTINDEQKNLSKYSVTVTHLDNNFKKTTVTGKDYYTVTTLEDRTTVTVDFAKIASTKENDGLYTVEITAEDYAGHKVTLGDGLDFSLNRFGSTFYSEDDYTLEFLTTGSDGNAYHRSVDNKLIVKELNPNKVYTDSTKKSEGSVLTVLVNGTSTKLVEGEDYKMSVSEEGTGTNKWYVYTYEIDPEAFEDSGTVVDGRYSVLIYGEDAAGNKNTNESNDSGKLQKDAAGEYNGKIEFTLDATAPIITTTGIESGKTYNAAAQKLEIFLSDNTPTGIAVYVNGELIKLSEADDLLADTATYLVWDEANGCYVLNVPEQDGIFDSQNVKTVATDAAGNMSEEAIEDFIVSTSFIVRWLNSVWFYVILALLLAAAAALGIVIFRKKKA